MRKLESFNNIFPLLKNNIRLILAVIGSGLLSSLFTALFLKSLLKPPQILILDLKTIMREELSKDLKEKTPEEIEKRFKTVLQKNLERLDHLTDSKRVIVLSKEAVLKGGQDITKYFTSQEVEK